MLIIRFVQWVLGTAFGWFGVGSPGVDRPKWPQWEFGRSRLGKSRGSNVIISQLKSRFLPDVVSMGYPPCKCWFHFFVKKQCIKWIHFWPRNPFGTPNHHLDGLADPLELPMSPFGVTFLDGLRPNLSILKSLVWGSSWGRGSFPRGWSRPKG